MKIGKDQFDATDGWYGDWYHCPNCKNSCAVRGYKFCPICGVSLEWEE